MVLSGGTSRRSAPSGTRPGGVVCSDRSGCFQLSRVIHTWILDITSSSSCRVSGKCLPWCFGVNPRLLLGEATTGVYPKRAHFFCVCTYHDGPQRAAFHGCCSASEAATTAHVVATRAAVGRCGPGHVVTPLRPSGTEECQGQGVGKRDELFGEDPEELFSLFEEESGGSWPPCLGESRATGAGPAAHHGAACRRRAHGLGSGLPCGAGGGSAGGGPAGGGAQGL